MFRRLDPRKIIETAEKLQNRIGERFPESGLNRVALEVEKIAQEAARRSERIQRPNIALRLAVGLVVALIGAIAFVIAQHVKLSTAEKHVEDVLDFVQMLESGLGAVVFLGAALLFLWTLENRLKRNRALEAIYELRSLAHVVDMHQLTKDPERVCGESPSTPSSPERRMTPFELGRYLDYCSEILSLLSKIAVVYAQGFQDGEVLDAVDQIEALTTGLARKIWQKITLLERLTARQSEVAKPAAAS